jgi:N-acyl-D-aspartate/D-glutamate deacylase
MTRSKGHMEYDLVVRGGTLVDGTGSPGVRGDVGVRGGRIVALGEAPGDARTTLEADGRVVAPGFLDLHTHYDAQVLWDPLLSISPWHGVTTVVMGNCGFGVAPTHARHRDLVLRTLEKVEGMSLQSLRAGCGDDWGFETFPEYLDAVERRGTAINVGAYVGHTPVRLYVMGEEAVEREARPDELARMRALVVEAMAAGALGFATSKAPTHLGYGGKPVPSRHATLEEICTLAGAMRDGGRGIMQCAIGAELLFREFREIVAASGRPITWTALLGGLLGKGSHRGFLSENAALVRDGLPVVPQVACRPLNLDCDLAEPFAFESLPVFGRLAAADRANRCRAYADPGFRDEVRQTFERAKGMPFVPDWTRTWISVAPGSPELEERTMAEVSRARGVDPVDLMLDLSLATDLRARFRIAVMNHDEEDVEELLLHPDTVIGLSDAGAHANQLCDACFSTHLLGHWVRQKGAMPIERAVWMLTGRTAEVMGITDRGRLGLGLAGDLVVVDPATVSAGPLRRVHDLPGGSDRLVSEASGIEAVVVNGVVVRREGRDAVDVDGPLPGAVLRGGRASGARGG